MWKSGTGGYKGKVKRSVGVAYRVADIVAVNGGKSVEGVPEYGRGIV